MFIVSFLIPVQVVTMTDTAPPLDEKSGYPPGQEAYPPPYPNPQEGGYPPPQGGYPPPQAYPPQEGYPPPQQGGYPPPQGSYPPPQQQGYPPPGYSDPQAPPPQQQQSTATTVVVQQQPVEVKIAFRDRPVVLPDGVRTNLLLLLALNVFFVHCLEYHCTTL